MRQNIALTNYCIPWNLRVGLFKIFGNMLCRLTDNQNLPLDGISHHFVRDELDILNTFDGTH